MGKMSIAYGKSILKHVFKLVSDNLNMRLKNLISSDNKLSLKISKTQIWFIVKNGNSETYT